MRDLGLKEKVARVRRVSWIVVAVALIALVLIAEAVFLYVHGPSTAGV